MESECLDSPRGAWKAYKDIGSQLSNEKKTGWLGYIRDEILPSYIGIIISHYKDPYQPTSIMECQQGFERCSICFSLFHPGYAETPEMRCKMSTVLSTPCSSGMAYLARETARNKEKKKETKLSKEEKHTKVQNLVTYHPLAITIDPTCLMTWKYVHLLTTLLGGSPHLINGY